MLTERLRKVGRGWLVKARAALEKDVGVDVMLAFYLIFAAGLCVVPYEPVDDLLRHLLAYTTGYDYSKMVAYSSDLGYNPYLPFDFLVGRLHLYLGHYSYVAVQALSVLVFGASLCWLLRGTNNNLRLLVVMAASHVIMVRLLNGRPAGFESSLMIAAYAAIRDERVRWWLHLCLGFAIACLYHLFWIYLLPLALLRRIYAIPLLAGLAGWHAYAGKAYWLGTWSFMTAKSSRLASVTECSEIWSFLVTYACTLLPLYYYWRKEKATIGICAYFVAPNQLRYIETVFPLALSALRNCSFRPPFVIIAVVFYFCAGTRLHTVRTPMNSFKNLFPAGSVVLELNGENFYRILYMNPKIRIVPSFESAWNPKDIQQAILEASKGTFDCRLLDRYHFDYIAESSLKESPQCLELVRLTTNYRIWRPKGAAAPASDS